MFKHILVPSDGSELSRKAISGAIALAKSLNAKIHGFYATETYPLIVYGDAVPVMPLSIQEFREQEVTRAKALLGYIEASARNAGVECTTSYVESPQPYDSIIKTATEKGCDLIFMASHGRRGLSAMLLGSETNKVLTHSNIPVLIYR